MYIVALSPRHRPTASFVGDYDSDVEHERHHAGKSLTSLSSSLSSSSDTTNLHVCVFTGDDANGSVSDEDSGDGWGRDSEDDTVHDAIRRES